MGRHKSSDVLCPSCKERRITPPLDRCQECWADAVVVMEAVVSIQQSHGTAKALAAKPVLEKVIQTGWKEDYLDEFQVNLLAVSERLSKEDQEAAEFYNHMAEAQ